jgi:hypothetical protein
VKGEYEREESYGEIHSFGGGGSILRRRIYFRGRFFYGDLWCEEFGFGGFWESKARGIIFRGFWAQGPGYPYGILELGSWTGCL